VSNRSQSTLDPFAESLEQWLTAKPDGDGLYYREVIEKLATEHNHTTTKSTLSNWWNKRQAAKDRAALTGRIAEGAETFRQVKSASGKSPPPDVEFLISFCRQLSFQLAAGEPDPKLLTLAQGFMRNVLDYAKIEEGRRALNLSEQKYRDQVEKARAEMEKLRAPKESLTDADRASIIAKVDDILGIR
jgi:hypothetical protein